MILKKFIFIKEENSSNLFINFYEIEFDFSKIIKLINKYSLENGALLINKKYLGRITNYENGRIINEKIDNYRNTKIFGLSTIPTKIYNYKIIINENKFISSLIKCFKKINQYLVIDFSSINKMILYKEINEKDILFLKEILNEIKIIKKDYNYSNIYYGLYNNYSAINNNEFLEFYEKKYNVKMKKLTK